MELYKEILVHILEKEEVQIIFPNLTCDSTKMLELECYQTLKKIKAVIEDERLEDNECFYRIEEIICIFESLGSDGGSRHDFG